MKNYIKFGLSTLLVLMPLAGCGNNDNAASQGSSETQTQPSSTDEGTASGANKDTSISENTKNETKLQQSSSAEKGGNGNGAAVKQDSKTPSASKESAPKTTADAVKQAANALDTRTPVLLPDDISISKGNYPTAAVHSETWYYQVKFLETKEPASINKLKATDSNTVVSIEGTEYNTSKDAKSNIQQYTKVEETNIDLGHGIKGSADAGAGHSYIIWNEGRWSMRIDSPNDPEYQTKKYPDAEALAKKIVDYLETHTLTPPKDIGVVSINNWKDHPDTTIQWQSGKAVYKVSGRDPFTALDAAVSMKSY